MQGHLCSFSPLKPDRIAIALQLIFLSMIFSENRHPLFRIMLWRAKRG
jgi:hypothetical protein